MTAPTKHAVTAPTVRTVTVSTERAAGAPTESSAPASVVAQLASLRVSAPQRAAIDVLADRIYGHLMRIVDLDRLFQVEQCVWSELDRLAIGDDEGDLATALLAEALHRIGWAPDRHCNAVPAGILEEEIIAAHYDDTCLMCRHDVADLEYRMSGRRCADLERAARDTEWMAIEHQAAAAWRAEHAEALRRFGLDEHESAEGEGS